MTRRDRRYAEREPFLFDLPLEPPDPAAAAPPSEIAEEPARQLPERAIAAQGTPQEQAREPAHEEVAFGEHPQPLEWQSVVPREPIIAHLWPRILSAGADLLVHFGALAAIALGLQFMAVEPRLEHWPSLLAFMAAFSFLYTVVSLAFWGQTAGMAWFGLAARESPQFPLSFAQATIRWLGGVGTLALAGLPLLLALRGSSLSDRMSRSKTYQGFPAG